MKSPRPLRLDAHAPATPEHCGITFKVRLTGRQATRLRALAASLDMDTREFIRAFLADELPTAADGTGGDLDALVAEQPLTVRCANRRKEAGFHARLARAARFDGLASAQEYVSRRLHVALWLDEREMVIHPPTGAVVGTEAEWTALHHLLQAEVVQRFEADPLAHPGFLDRFPARNPMLHTGSLEVLDDPRLSPGPVTLAKAA